MDVSNGIEHDDGSDLGTDAMGTRMNDDDKLRTMLSDLYVLAKKMDACEETVKGFERDAAQAARCIVGAREKFAEAHKEYTQLAQQLKVLL